MAARLFGLHIGGLHHVFPLLGFVNNELAEFSGRTHKRCAAATVRINPGSKPANLITTARTEMVSGRAKGVSYNHLPSRFSAPVMRLRTIGPVVLRMSWRVT